MIITVTDSYYCDDGPHAGKYHVRLEGYVSERDLYELTKSGVTLVNQRDEDKG